MGLAARAATDGLVITTILEIIVDAVMSVKIARVVRVTRATIASQYGFAAHRLIRLRRAAMDLVSRVLLPVTVSVILARHATDADTFPTRHQALRRQALHRAHPVARATATAESYQQSKSRK